MTESNPLDEIQARISDCRTYNFGMYNADKLAHEDAPRMLAALRAVESVCVSAANNNPYLTPDEPGTAYVGVEEIRTAIGAALS